METYERLLSERISRRQLLKGFTVLGVSAGANLSLLRKSSAAAAQVDIGVIYPNSGAMARFGQACVNASKLAADHINARGGIKSLKGAKLNLIITDCQTDATITRNVTERIMTTHKLAAATGVYSSSYTLVSTEVAERYGIPFVTGSIANEITGRGFKYTFQVSPKAEMFGHMQVDTLAWLTKEGKKRVAIAYEDTAYGTSTAKGLTDRSKQKGYEIVLSEAYAKAFTDATPLVNKIKAAKPDALFPVSYITDAILIIKTMKQLDVNAAIIGGGAGYLIPEFYNGLGPDANYVYSVGSWNYDINCPEVTKFSEEYEKKYGEFLMEHAGEAYVMMWVIADALERAASTDPKKVREALVATNLTKGPGAAMPGCRVEFDTTGWNKHVHPVMTQWQKGQLRTVYPASDARVKPIWPVPPWKKR
jgi:branched-chain amino acid transport system substrate-binding protein